MNYGAEAYENPPAPVMAGVEQPIGADIDGLRNRRPSLPPAKAKMGIGKAVFSGQSTKANPKMGTSAGQLLDTLIYAGFVVVIVYIAFAKNSSGAFYYTRSLFATFTKCPRKDGTDLVDVNVIDDVWEFMNATVLRGLYYGEFDDENSQEGSVLYANILLGNPTLRMIKVRNDTCEVPDGFKREIKECFGMYTEDREDRETFGTQGQRFVWQSQQALETEWERGKQSDYGGGGFVVELPKRDLDQARGTLQQLKDVRFIDRGTRALFVDFSMYNPNVNLFCVARILFEFPPTGGVTAWAKITPLDLIRYGDGYGAWIAAAEGIFLGYVVFFLLQELLEIARSRFGYFKHFWNLMDATIIILSVFCCYVSFWSTNVCVHRVNVMMGGDNITSATMDDATNAVTIYSHWSSILLFLSWVKVFKYISINKTMSQLSQTLTRSAKDIGGFAVMFCVFFFAYAQFGYLVFGSQIEDYSSFVKAMLALLRTILGDFDYVGLQNANRILGPVFFVTYVFFVFFVLLNMFLAIINDSYVEVKGEMAKKKTVSLMDWVRHKMVCMTKRHSGRPDPPDDPMITYEEYKTELMRIGYKESVIVDAFTRIDVKEEDPVTESAMEAIQEQITDIYDKRGELEMDTFQKRTQHRISSLEAVLGESNKRLDVALVMLADSENRRTVAKQHELQGELNGLLDGHGRLKEE